MAVSATLVAGACTSAGGGGAGGLDPVGLSSASLRAEGRALAETTALDGDAPRYGLRATIDPVAGTVVGHVTAEVVVTAPSRPLHFRVFPNLPELTDDFVLAEVSVGGATVAAQLDRALLTLPPPGGDAGRRVAVEIGFSYTARQTTRSDPLSAALGTLGGGALSAGELGLLARHPGGLAMGHWFPAYMPDSDAGGADPEPGGYGDIGNFPAAMFAARIDVPASWTVISGGVNTSVTNQGDRLVFDEEGAGLRDFALYVVEDVATASTEAGGVVIRASGPAGAAQHLEVVAAHAAAAVELFSETFGPYPWTELDVVSVPLSAAVGGMEWPGMVWIGSEVFAGQIPGLGDLGGLAGGLGSILDGLDGLGGLEGLGGLGELGGLDVGGLGEALSTMREFVIAHEVAHQWWHALVGNDSIAAPVVDEPLAQFSACLYWERIHGPVEGRRVCDAQVALQYRAMRSLGIPDAPADQPSDGFASSLQYGGVVYGKAPGFFGAARDRLGEDAFLAGLRAYVGANAFGLADADDVLSALRAAVPAQATAIDGLWQRWIREAHGDEDLGVDGSDAIAGLGALGPLFGDLGSILGTPEVDPGDFAGSITRLLEDILGAIPSG